MAVTLDAFVGFVMVLSVWSYLFKENIFSKTATTITIAISTMHAFMYNTRNAYDMTVAPILAGDFLYIIPIILGLLLFTRLSSKYSWLASYSYSVSLGLGTGATLSTLFSSNVAKLIVNTASQPFIGVGIFEQLSGLLLFIGTVLAITYWVFTREATGIFGYGVRVGRWFLMISIGYLYAEDVVWAQSLFVAAMEIVLLFVKQLMGMA